jgi:hypothetical protein
MKGIKEKRGASIFPSSAPPWLNLSPKMLFVKVSQSFVEKTPPNSLIEPLSPLFLLPVTRMRTRQPFPNFFLFFTTQCRREAGNQPLRLHVQQQQR